MLIEFHRRMLADEVRSAAFEAALRQVIIPGVTTVADIGAGTGVLGFMAQKLGAKEVHLVEHGPVIELAARLADDNRIPGLHFWQAHSGEILDPPQVDVVVAEILGNVALEENALETLADARRFLRPGGVIIPARLEQYVAPVRTDRFWRELRSWERAPLGLDFRAAQALSLDNLYVQRIAPADLAGNADNARRWDLLEFMAERISRERRGHARWDLQQATDIYGLALWWQCELVHGVVLSTSPFAAPTHWDQVHAPMTEPVRALPGDVLEVAIESETGGGESGIGMRWSVTHRRGGAELSRQQQDIGRGFLG
jgi:protein arginine N-methyltransferase 1